MTKEKVKEAIVNKFGTLSNFARVTGTDRYRWQKLLSRQATQDELRELHGLVKGTTKSISGTVDPEKVELVREAIRAYGSIYKFCKDYPEFPQRQIYNLFESDRMRQSELLDRLFEHFKIE